MERENAIAIKLAGWPLKNPSFLVQSHKMVFFIPGTDSKIFQGARRVFTFHIEIFSLLSELANSVMKRSKCEKWKLFKPLEKFKRKGLGWVICFLRLIEVYLYAIIIFQLTKKNWLYHEKSRVSKIYTGYLST